MTRTWNRHETYWWKRNFSSSFPICSHKPPAFSAVTDMFPTNISLKTGVTVLPVLLPLNLLQSEDKNLLDVWGLLIYTRVKQYQI